MSKLESSNAYGADGEYGGKRGSVSASEKGRPYRGSLVGVVDLGDTPHDAINALVAEGMFSLAWILM
jgi:hypothetical protein